MREGIGEVISGEARDKAVVQGTGWGRLFHAKEGVENLFQFKFKQGVGVWFQFNFKRRRKGTGLFQKREGIREVVSDEGRDGERSRDMLFFNNSDFIFIL